MSEAVEKMAVEKKKRAVEKRAVEEGLGDYDTRNSRPSLDWRTTFPPTTIPRRRVGLSSGTDWHVSGPSTVCVPTLIPYRSSPSSGVRLSPLERARAEQVKSNYLFNSFGPEQPVKRQVRQHDQRRSANMPNVWSLTVFQPTCTSLQMATLWCSPSSTSHSVSSSCPASCSPARSDLG